MSRSPGTSGQGPALEQIFHPRSVAVVGATTAALGDQFIASLQAMRFPGPI